MEICDCIGLGSPNQGMALILVMVELCELETVHYLVGAMGQAQDTALVRDSTREASDDEIDGIFYWPRGGGV